MTIISTGKVIQNQTWLDEECGEGGKWSSEWRHSCNLTYNPHSLHRSGSDRRISCKYLLSKTSQKTSQKWIIWDV